MDSMLDIYNTGHPLNLSIVLILDINSLSTWTPTIEYNGIL